MDGNILFSYSKLKVTLLHLRFVSYRFLLPKVSMSFKNADI